MNVYVETNFVLEIALLQEHHKSCEDILLLCEAGGVRLVLPAYSISEPYEALGRRHRERQTLRKELDQQLRQLARTASHDHKKAGFQDMLAFLTESSEEDEKRLENTRGRLLRVAEIIPLGSEVLGAATQYQKGHDLKPQDAVVYASVRHHLNQDRPTSSCFLSRDKDFADPDIIAALEELGCRMLFRFDHGHEFIRGSVS